MIYLLFRSYQSLSKLLESYFDLAIYLFNGAFIACFLHLSLLASSQEIVLDYSVLQELFKNTFFLMSYCTFICLFSSFRIFSKHFIRGFILIIICFLFVWL